MKLSVLQIKEQKVLVDELCNLKKNRVSGGSGKVSKFIRSHHYLCSYDGKHANHMGYYVVRLVQSCVLKV